MTQKNLGLMELRRTFNKRDTEKYNQYYKKVFKEIKEAKESWLSEKCLEIVILQEKHDVFHPYKKIKQLAGIYRTRQHNAPLDNILFNIHENDIGE